MSAASVKGWCPGALRPMLSGDGLVVRVRPFGGRIDTAQIAGLAQLADDDTVTEEPRGVEPAALREQAADAVARDDADRGLHDLGAAVGHGASQYRRAAAPPVGHDGAGHDPGRHDAARHDRGRSVTRAPAASCSGYRHRPPRSRRC